MTTASPRYAGAGPVWVSHAVVGYAPEVASMVVRAAELPAELRS
ncbi:hypothetical protein SBD_4184 [Streptomyces bottropensis ATCC 25435]|uniref:Uncharacterized protein n=1 Tax=Streptomyces bottropensis ATCC 25435 TaxID=1054862 RepID=M3FNH8_9ACTN|nr:hypothetical protein SBD_4184 [Streptomyces bottropensis ATCC 25435]